MTSATGVLALFANSPDLVLFVDRDGRLAGRNPAAAAYAPDARTAADHVPAEYRPTLQTAIADVLAANEPRSFEWGEVGAAGVKRWFHAVVSCVGTDTERAGVLVSSRDITALKQSEVLNAELELRVSERTRQLESALRDLETFNSMVSHDLRGPLAVLQMALDMIEQERDLPEAVPALLGRMQRAIDNMSSLVEDLLTLARVGENALEPTTIDVTALCSDIVAEQRLAHPDRHVEVRIEPALYVFADRALLRAALANLIGNAWKYTGRAAAPKIEIGAVQRAEGRALYVRDNGIGFDMKEYDRLFAPFVRLANAKEFKGTGVGLAMVQRIVERHGGRVHAEGAVGQGATFFVVLPASAWVIEESLAS